MSHNTYTYTVWKTDATSLTERATAGYPQGKTSTDGLLVVGDKRDNVEPSQTTVPTKPSYVTESMPNWPYLNHEEVLKFISYMATSSGAGDGYTFNPKGA